MSSTTLPITHVTLYTSGVGYFERGGEVEGDAGLTLLFPVGQINDVLKSLVLLDGGGGSIQPVTYAAQDPVRKALQAFSLDVSDNPDRATLLNRMRGTSVTLTTDDPAPVTGVVLGVESQTVLLPGELGAMERYTLSLLDGDALHSVPLDSVRSLAINDAALADEMRQALATVAQGRDAAKRPVTLTFTGEGTRPVRIGYLTEAPAWQTSYRLVLGETPRLQGWALVQNTGQDDWTDTHLTLVSGRPISFIQDLYTPLYVHRPTVQPRILASPTPQTYAGNLLEEEEGLMSGYVADIAPAAMMAMSAAPAPMAGASRSRRQEALPQGRATMNPSQAVQGSMAATGAQLGTALFAYGIDVPVSVPRQQSAMIPFLAGEVGAERVSVYNGRVQADHPLSGVRLKNTTDLHLMGGPLTVFETHGEGSSGYVGDALIEDTQPGQMRLLTYAIDLAVDAASHMDAQSGLITQVQIHRGTLHVSLTQRRITEYQFKNNAAQPRRVVVEHPRLADHHLLDPPAPDEQTATHYRLDVSVPAGAAVPFRVEEERQFLETHLLTNLGPEHLLFYAQSGPVSEAVRAALGEVSRRHAGITALESQIADAEAQLEAITKGQERIRKNMDALDHKSDLYRRYVGELDKQETQIRGLLTQNEARQAKIMQAQTELEEYVAGLELG